MEVKINGEGDNLDGCAYRDDHIDGQLENEVEPTDLSQMVEAFLSNDVDNCEPKSDEDDLANFLQPHSEELDQLENQEISQQNEIQPNENSNLQRSDSQSDDELKSLRSQVADYKTKIEILEQNLKDKQFENDEIVNKNKNLSKAFEQKEKGLLSEIQAISDKLELEQDRVSDLERQIEEFKETINWESSQRQKFENDLDSSTLHSDKLMSQMKSQIEQLESQLKSKLSQDTNEYIDILKGINEDLEAQLHDAQEEHKLAKIQLEKELAVRA